MSRKANPYDNAIMESFFATLKTECFQNQIPKSRREAKLILFDYIETFYNRSRLHSALRTNHHWNSKTNSTVNNYQKQKALQHEESCPACCLPSPRGGSVREGLNPRARFGRYR